MARKGITVARLLATAETMLIASPPTASVSLTEKRYSTASTFFYLSTPVEGMTCAHAISLKVQLPVSSTIRRRVIIHVCTTLIHMLAISNYPQLPRHFSTPSMSLPSSPIISFPRETFYPIGH